MRLAVESKYIDKFTNYDMPYNDTVFFDKCQSTDCGSSQNFLDFHKPKTFDTIKVNGFKDEKHIVNCNCCVGRNCRCIYCSKVHKKVIRKRNRDLNQRKKFKFYTCTGCPATFKNVVQLRKHSRVCKNIAKHERKCVHADCIRTFSKLTLLINHLKNDHITEAGCTFEFYTLQEFENWRNKCGSEFVLVKTFKNLKAGLIYRYYICQFEFLDSSQQAGSRPAFCEGKIFVTKKTNGAIVKYMPHDPECKRAKKTSSHNGVNETPKLGNTVLEENLLQKDKLRSILSNHKFNEIEAEKDIESVKRSIRNRISQLNECISVGDVQSLLNIEHVLKELLKTYVKTDELELKNEGPPELEKISEIHEPFTSELRDADDVNKVAFNVGPYSISSLHLKSLDYYIPSTECAILKSVAPDFRKGWLYDTILDAFLYKLCKPHPNAMFLETAVSQIINNNSLNSLRMQLGDKYFTNIENIFVAFNPNGKHWVLLVVKPKLKQIQIYDPTSKKKSTSQTLMKFVKQLICVLLNDFGSNEVWGIVSPKHIIQRGNYNCGVYVCWYAERILKNEDVISDFSGSDFRKYIYDFIGGCGEDENSKITQRF